MKNPKQSISRRRALKWFGAGLGAAALAGGGGAAHQRCHHAND